jgi:predicted DNA-binding transcriptional regulator AlpA
MIAIGERIGIPAMGMPLTTDIMSPAAAANMLGVETSTLDRWRHERQLPGIKLSSKVVVYSRSALERWVTEQAAK